MYPFVCLAVFLGSVITKGSVAKCSKGNYGTSTALLKKQLLCNYVREAPPGVPVTVEAGMAINDLSVVEDENLLYVYYTVSNEWEDSSLRFDPEKFGGLDDLELKYGLWSPQMIVLDTKDSIEHEWYQNQMKFYERKIFVYSRGSVWWHKTEVAGIHCNFNFYFWPFDSQICLMKFGSIKYDRKEVQFIFDFYRMTPQRKDKNGWTVESVTGTNVTDIQEWDLKALQPQIALEFRLKRSYTTLSVVIAVPTLVCGILTMVVLWLGYGSLRRNSTYLSILWHCVNLVYIGSRLPVGASGNILLLNLLRISLIVTTLSTLTSSMGTLCSVIFIAPPSILTVAADRIRSSIASKLLLVPEQLKPAGGGLAYEWVVLSVVSDRLLFAVYLGVYIPILIFSFT